MNLSVAITHFSHSKMKQWSKDVQFVKKTITDFLPFITTSLTNGSNTADVIFGLILLLKHETKTSLLHQALLNTNHAFLKRINLYIVTVGVSNKALPMDYRDMLPAGTKFANIRDMDHVAIFSMEIFKDLCPGRV